MDSSVQPTIIPLINHNSQPPPPEDRLGTIPLEVLLQITRQLTTPDYAKLRLTNKNIEEKLRNAFAREFFSKRQFMLTRFSLQALVDISKSRFSSSLTHVIIGLERPPQQHHHSTMIGQHANGYYEYTTFLNSGQDVEMLAEGFSGLPNLETVGMRDFNSRTRWRDSPNVEWKSYGSRTYVLVTGHRLEFIHTHEILSGHPSLDKINQISRIFLTILRSLAKSNSQAANFEVILQRLSLHDHCFDVPDYLLPSIQPVLGQLRSLFLEINSESGYTTVSLTDPTDVISNYKLRKFLALTPNLEHFRLNFRQYQAKEGMKSLLSWFSAPVSSSPIVPSTISLGPPPEIHFSKLKQLEIGILEIDAPILLAIMNKFRSTLESVSFHKVCLINPDVINPRKKVNLWAKFFDQLSESNIDLRAIKVSFVTQSLTRRNGIIDTRSIKFNDSKERSPHIRKWAGTNAKSALRDFNSQATVIWMDTDKDESGIESDSEPSPSNDEDMSDEDADENGDSDSEEEGNEGDAVEDDE